MAEEKALEMVEVMSGVACFLPLCDRLAVAGLCKAYFESEGMWFALYSCRFGFFSLEKGGVSWRESYRERVLRPLPADVVEVSWHGKFNLSFGAGDEARTVRAGRSWWSAKIVKVQEPFYKVIYPGWSQGWDEWVKRSRVRWPSEAASKKTAAKVGANVEIIFKPDTWHIRPPVWLEAQVLRQRKRKLLIAPLPMKKSNKQFWIDRSEVYEARTNFLQGDDDTPQEPYADQKYHSHRKRLSKYLKKRLRKALRFSEKLRHLLF